MDSMKGRNFKQYWEVDVNIIDRIFDYEIKFAERTVSKEAAYLYVANHLKTLLKIAIEKGEGFEEYLKSLYTT